MTSKADDKPEAFGVVWVDLGMQLSLPADSAEQALAKAAEMRAHSIKVGYPTDFQAVHVPAGQDIIVYLETSVTQ